MFCDDRFYALLRQYQTAHAAAVAAVEASARAAATAGVGSEAGVGLAAHVWVIKDQTITSEEARVLLWRRASSATPHRASMAYANPLSLSFSL
jgi:hypothetical protein